MYKTKSLRSALLMLISVFLLSCSFPLSAKAASTSIGVSSSTVYVGDTVSLTISSSTGGIGGVDLYVTYDSSYLTYTGTGGSCSMEFYNDNGSGSYHIVGYYPGRGETGSFSITLNFTANKAGSSSVYVSGEVSDGEALPMSTSFSSGSVTINTKSSDATLKSLTVGSGSLSPAFSPSTTSYSLSVANSVSKLTVSANVNDAAATVSVSGNNSLSVGQNTVTITVTAGDSTVKKYTITVTRAAGTASSPSPRTSSSPSPSPSASPLTAIFSDGTELEIGTFTDDQILKGFSRTTLTFNDQEIDAIQYSDDSQKLVYLNGAGDYPSGFYYFDAAVGLATPVTALSTTASSYMLIDPTSSIAVPSGYEKQYVELGSAYINVFAPIGIAEPNNYLICAVNAAGELGLYLYDVAEGTLQRYNFAISDPNAVSSATPEPTTSPSPSPSPTPSPEGTSGLWGLDLHDTVTLVLCGSALILLIAVIVLAVLLAMKSHKLRLLRIGDIDFEQNYAEPSTAPDSFWPEETKIEETKIEEDTEVTDTTSRKHKLKKAEKTESTEATEKEPSYAKATSEYKFNVDDVIKEYKDSSDKDKK